MRSSSVKLGLLVLVCVLLPLGGALRGVAQTPPTVISAGLPQEVEDLLSARQSRMQLLTPEQRNAFTQRLAAWDALPRAEREDRRARYLAWRELDATERMRLQGVANEVAAFPPERQQALHQEFAALDAAQRAGWRLGMALGSDYEKLHPLVAYVPVQQRLPLLNALRASPYSNERVAPLSASKSDSCGSSRSIAACACAARRSLNASTRAS